MEFSTNDSPSPWTSQSKEAYEWLLRSLLALPGAPAVVLLHHFPWFKAAGDGLGAGLYYREPEGQLTLLSHVRGRGRGQGPRACGVCERAVVDAPHAARAWDHQPGGEDK